MNNHNFIKNSDMEEQTITYNGEKLKVVYSVSQYYRETYTDPKEGGEVEIEEIYIDGCETNLIDLLEPQLYEIESMLEINLHDYIR